MPADKRATADVSPPPPSDGLTDVQRTFALEYLENGFNQTRAYSASHPAAAVPTCATEGWRLLRNPKVRAWLNERLEDAWRPRQMGGEQALGRVADLATWGSDDRVKLAALRTILEQTGKLKSVTASIDGLTEALKADLLAHKDA